MKRLLVCLFSIMILLLPCSCKKEEIPEEPSFCEVLTVSYENDIEPIMNTGCAVSGCHVAGFEWGELSSYDDVKQKVDEGRFWFLVGIVKAMPPQNKLFDEDLDKIKCWLDDGALNN